MANEKYAGSVAIQQLITKIKGADEAIVNNPQPGMTVGASDNLISDAKINSNAPYLYRPVLNGVGNRAWQKLVGATIANNQLTNELIATGGNYGLTWTNTDDKTLRLEGRPTTTAFAIVKTYSRTQVGHKLMITGGKENAGIRGGQSLSYTYCDTGTGIIIEAITETASQLAIQFPTPYPTIDVTLEPRCYDLTEMFGSTIADYAYTLDQANKGAGVAWLKSYGFFGKYAPYDAGSLISTKAEKKKVVGFNQWDEETQGGYYNASGTYTSTNTQLCTKNKFAVIPSTAYCFTVPIHTSSNSNQLSLIEYDANGTFLRRNDSDVYYKATGYVVYTTSADCYYLNINLGVPYGTTYQDDICINLSKTTGTPKNGDYLPYTSQEYDLGSDELRGLFKLDGNNNIVADGDIKTADGTITRKYGIVDLGTLNWTYNDIYLCFVSDAISDAAAAAQGLCEDYVYTTAWITSPEWAAGNKQWNITGSICRIKDTNYTDPAVFKTAMSGVYLVYELATPTTEQGTPFIDPSIVYPNGTEEYIDTRTVPVPVGNETEYTEDLKLKLEELPVIPAAPETDGAYVLKATVADGVPVYTWEASE